MKNDEFSVYDYKKDFYKRHDFVYDYKEKLEERLNMFDESLQHKPCRKEIALFNHKTIKTKQKHEFV